MFPAPAGRVGAAGDAYGSVATKQAEKVHNQEHPEDALHAENNAQGKKDLEDPQKRQEDKEELKKAMSSSMAHI